jgi:hypothetical protein
LRPLRVINRAPGLKLVVQTLLSSLRPIGNIVLICCTFFVIFGILGVQLFKGAFYYCEGPDIKNVRNKTDCLLDKRNLWLNRKYNFDDLGKALMSLFVLSSRDGWVNIMYTGLDAVGVDQQVRPSILYTTHVHLLLFALLKLRRLRLFNFPVKLTWRSTIAIHTYPHLHSLVLCLRRILRPQFLGKQRIIHEPNYSLIMFHIFSNF